MSKRILSLLITLALCLSLGTAMAPKDNATRAQIATMFQRFCVELGETVSP